jgi:hypothetical protein
LKDIRKTSLGDVLSESVADRLDNLIRHNLVGQMFELGIENFEKNLAFTVEQKVCSEQGLMGEDARHFLSKTEKDNFNRKKWDHDGIA